MTTQATGRTTVPRIVVGVDGSEGSRWALEWALHLARRLGLDVLVVTAWQYVPQAAGPGLMPFALLPDDEREALERAARLVIDSVPAGSAQVEHRVVDGHARQSLVELSAGQAALVVGSRGHGVVAGAVLGSVSQGCVTHATCPVVVVPQGTVILL